MTEQNLTSQDQKPIDLLPCPFCGGSAKQEWGMGGGWIVQCFRCGSTANSVKTWNNRRTA